MIDAYNMDGSDSSVDYFCVRFYGSTEYDWALRDAEEARILAENSALIQHTL